MYSGNEGFRKGGIRETADLGKEGFCKGGMQEGGKQKIMDTGKKGFKTDGIQERSINLR